MIEFDAGNPDPALMRRVILERLRKQGDWHQLDVSLEGYASYLKESPPRANARDIFAQLVLHVFWELCIESQLSVVPRDPIRANGS